MEFIPHSDIGTSQPQSGTIWPQARLLKQTFIALLELLHYKHQQQWASNDPQRRAASSKRRFVMGCGASKVTPTGGEDIKSLQANGSKTAEHEPRSNGHANGNINRPKSSDRKESDSKPSSALQNGNTHVNSSDNKDASIHQQASDKNHFKETQDSPAHGELNG